MIILMILILLTSPAWAGSPLDGLFPPTTSPTTAPTTTTLPTLKPEPITHFTAVKPSKPFTANKDWPVYEIMPIPFGEVVFFQPTISFIGAPGQVNYLVAVFRNGKLYFATKGVFDEISWAEWRAGEPFPIYESGPFVAQWACKAIMNAHLRMEQIQGADVYCACQVTADLEDVQGCRFRFVYNPYLRH